MAWHLPLLAAPLAAALMAATAGPLLRRLPEPDPSTPDADVKVPYAALATPGFVAAAAVASGVGAGLACVSLPPALWWAWSALWGPNVLACAIDARTTWLPRALSWAGAALAASGVAVAAVASGSLPAAFLAAGCALGAWAFFHAVWRVSGAFGYGDVRLATTIGAVAGLTSVAFAVWAILLGTVAGAACGVVHRLRGRSDAFPYGPGLLAGPFAALAFGVA